MLKVSVANICVCKCQCGRADHVTCVRANVWQETAAEKSQVSFPFQCFGSSALVLTLPNDTSCETCRPPRCGRLQPLRALQGLGCGGVSGLGGSRAFSWALLGEIWRVYFQLDGFPLVLLLRHRVYQCSFIPDHLSDPWSVSECTTHTHTKEKHHVLCL